MSWAFRRRSSTGWGKERMKKWSIGNLWKKYKYVGLVVLAGIVLMVLPAGTSAPDPQKDSSGFSLEDTERRMEELLGRMDGVGRVQVMLTLKNGSSLELAEDADSTERDGETRAQREPVTLNRGSGDQDVVCQGAGSSAVRLAVTEAVAALTGLPADRITVVQWNS